MNDVKRSKIPETMRVAQLHDITDIRIISQAVPTLEPGDLLVRVTRSGICSGDLMPWYIRRKAPLVLGHEPVGEIVAIAGGKAAQSYDGHTFALGERVAMHHHAPCFSCEFCERGAYVHCATWRATKLDPGGISEYVRVPHANLNDTLVLPKSVADDEAVLVEPVACVMKSLRRARLYGGDVVYVIGLGVMGLLHVAVLDERGYTVVASDLRPERRERALPLGATAAVAPEDAAAALAELGGANVVICGPGSANALDHALATVAPAGTVVMFTPIDPAERYSFDQSQAYFRDVTLTASYSCGPNDTREALRWLAENELTTTQLGAELYDLEQTGEAYTAMQSAAIGKAIIRF